MAIKCPKCGLTVILNSGDKENIFCTFCGYDSKIMEIKKVWVSWINTDLTEGRGRQIPLCVCESKATSIRMGRKKNVQGCNAEIRGAIAVKYEGKWLGPCNIISPSSEDKIEDAKENNYQIAKEKAKKLGLSEEDISALKNR